MLCEHQQYPAQEGVTTVEAYPGVCQAYRQTCLLVHCLHNSHGLASSSVLHVKEPNNTKAVSAVLGLLRQCHTQLGVSA